MNTLRRRLIEARASESGLSLIEVIIAMMIFAMIATGIGYTMLAALSLTKDSSARQQAANLAAQEIDLTRSIDNLFNLVDKTTTTTINGRTFTIQRTARWVSDPNVDQRCGIGGGILRYKRVNVTVAWSGMTSSVATVRADTLIDPGVRINDPDLGTILVSVSDSGGNPVAGATVKVAPGAKPNGAKPLSAQPAVTDAQGCTYALMVDPGNYDVTISKSGYVDIQQNAAPSKPVSVDASSASAAEVTLDLGGKFPLNYATNYVGSRELPAKLDVSFVSTYPTSIQSNAPASALLFPFTGGYEVLAGVYNDPAYPATFCKSVDPREWPAGTAAGANYLAGVRPDAVAAVPGGTAPTAKIPMGVVKVTMTNDNNRYLVAIAQSSGPSGTADPGCDIGTIYNFGTKAKNATVTIALPFGSWKLYSATTVTGTTTQISISSIQPLTPAQKTTSGNVVTLDPRAVAP